MLMEKEEAKSVAWILLNIQGTFQHIKIKEPTIKHIKKYNIFIDFVTLINIITNV